MARLTGLEPATPGVTGRYSNRLSYNRALASPGAFPGVEWQIRARRGRVKPLALPPPGKAGLPPPPDRRRITLATGV